MKHYIFGIHVTNEIWQIPLGIIGGLLALGLFCAVSCYICARWLVPWTCYYLAWLSTHLERLENKRNKQ